MTRSLGERFRARLGTGRFLPLLVNLVLLFALYPFMERLGFDHLFSLSFFLLLLTAVYSLSEEPRHLVVAIVLAIPSAIALSWSFVQGGAPLKILSNGLALLFLAYVLAVLMAAVLREGEVDGDKIAGAVCGYLLIGLGFALLFNMIDLVEVEAFRTPEEIELSGKQGDEFGFLYFSFVTLTTLGYGDITPLSLMARTAAWFEAVIGQLYIAILLARLVALQIADGLAAREG